MIQVEQNSQSNLPVYIYQLDVFRKMRVPYHTGILHVRTNLYSTKVLRGSRIENIHTVIRVEVRDLSVFWAGHVQLVYAMQL